MWLENDTFRGLFFAAIGLFMFSLELLGYLRSRKRKQMACARTTATVTFKKEYPKRRGVKHRPTYEYCVDGVVFKAVARFLCSPPFAMDGEVIELYYIPKAPNKIYVPREREYKEKQAGFGNVFLIILGLVFMLSGLAVAFGFIKVP